MNCNLVIVKPVLVVIGFFNITDTPIRLRHCPYIIDTHTVSCRYSHNTNTYTLAYSTPSSFAYTALTFQLLFVVSVVPRLPHTTDTHTPLHHCSHTTPTYTHTNINAPTPQTQTHSQPDTNTLTTLQTPHQHTHTLTSMPPHHRHTHTHNTTHTTPISAH